MTPQPGSMTAEDALNAALQMLVSEEFAPAIMTAFEGSNDVPTAVALLVFPIVVRMQQELDLPEEEMFGTEEGDGIVAYLVQELINIAGESGYLPEEGDEAMARQLGEATFSKLGELLNHAKGAMGGGGEALMQPGAPMPQAQAPGGLMQEAS